MSAAELNDAVSRDQRLAELLAYYRAAKVPDGSLTDERRHAIVMSLKQERDELWLRIVVMCDDAAVAEKG
jgi:hypothetical protein